MRRRARVRARACVRVLIHVCARVRTHALLDLAIIVIAHRRYLTRLRGAGAAFPTRKSMPGGGSHHSGAGADDDLTTHLTFWLIGGIGITVACVLGVFVGYCIGIGQSAANMRRLSSVVQQPTSSPQPPPVSVAVAAAARQRYAPYSQQFMAAPHQHQHATQVTEPRFDVQHTTCVSLDTTNTAAAAPAPAQAPSSSGVTITTSQTVPSPSTALMPTNSTIHSPQPRYAHSSVPMTARELLSRAIAAQEARKHQ